MAVRNDDAGMVTADGKSLPALASRFGPSGRQFVACQTFAVPSFEPVRMFEPSGEKLAEATESVWPARVSWSEPSIALQSFAVSS